MKSDHMHRFEKPLTSGKGTVPSPQRNSFLLHPDDCWSVLPHRDFVTSQWFYTHGITQHVTLWDWLPHSACPWDPSELGVSVLLFASFIKERFFFFFCWVLPGAFRFQPTAPQVFVMKPAGSPLGKVRHRATWDLGGLSLKELSGFNPLSPLTQSMRSSFSTSSFLSLLSSCLLLGLSPWDEQKRGRE